MRASDKNANAPARKAEPSHTRPVRNASRVHRGRADNAQGRKEGPLVASIQRAIASGIISGQLARTLRIWGRLWRVPDLPDNITFRHNARLRRTIARWVIESNTVELSARFFELPRDHHEILCHELAHAAAVRLGGRSAPPHGSTWRELVRRVGCEPKLYCVSNRRTHMGPTHVRLPLIYEHRCPVCHAVRYAKKTVKSWRCVECSVAGQPGHLVITAIAKVSVQ